MCKKLIFKDFELSWSFPKRPLFFLPRIIGKNRWDWNSRLLPEGLQWRHSAVEWNHQKWTFSTAKSSFLIISSSACHVPGAVCAFQQEQKLAFLKPNSSSSSVIGTNPGACNSGFSLKASNECFLLSFIQTIRNELFALERVYFERFWAQLVMWNQQKPFEGLKFKDSPGRGAQCGRPCLSFWARNHQKWTFSTAKSSPPTISSSACQVPRRPLLLLFSTTTANWFKAAKLRFCLIGRDLYWSALLARHCQSVSPRDLNWRFTLLAYYAVIASSAAGLSPTEMNFCEDTFFGLDKIYFWRYHTEWCNLERENLWTPARWPRSLSCSSFPVTVE